MWMRRLTTVGCGVRCGDECGVGYRVRCMVGYRVRCEFGFAEFRGGCGFECRDRFQDAIVSGGRPCEPL